MQISIRAVELVDIDRKKVLIQIDTIKFMKKNIKRA